MNTEPLPWQQGVLADLAARHHAQRMPHALLIAGVPGIGKGRFAGALASLLLCTEMGRDQACGICRSCRLAAADTHPDRFRLAPEEGKTQIIIDDVRRMLEFVARTPQVSARKVVLIEPADAMNRHTANCLLKTLEEPPGATHLLLVSAVPMRMAATIRSRCQRITLALPRRSEVLPWLHDQVGDEAAAALDTATGRPLAAMEIHQSGGIEKISVLRKGLLAFLHRDLSLGGLIEIANQLPPGELLELLQGILQDLLRWQVRAEANSLRNPATAAWYQQLAATAVRPDSIHQLLQDTVSATRQQASTANPNWQLLLETLLIRWRDVLGRGLRA